MTCNDHFVTRDHANKLIVVGVTRFCSVRIKYNELETSLRRCVVYVREHE
jgi:hypothetical protein